MRLVADVGGTNARFALSSKAGETLSERRFETAVFQTFDDALAAYLAEVAPASITDARIAAAGPVDGGILRLTNLPWTITASAVSERLGGAGVRLYNDLEAVALCVPHLDAVRCVWLGEAENASPVAPRIAINVGTGFGAASVSGEDDRTSVRAGEAGHMRFAACGDDELPLLAHARTVEDYLSGSGLAQLYRAVCHARGAQAAGYDASGIFTAATGDANAAAAVAHFTRLLGRVAGDLVLATGAWGGAYLCGSVVQAWRGVADLTAFRTAFCDKGKMSARMAGVPACVIAEAEPALLGLTYPDRETAQG